MSVLGLDTSNYTTSVAVFDGAQAVQEGTLLTVKAGELGLRQSEALFQHVKNLPALFDRLSGRGLLSGLTAVAASTRPRAVEGSYMPCFLAGQSQGLSLARTLGVPFYEVSHQQGHLAAAAFGAGRMEVLDTPFLAWHLSGGTTELLHVKPDGWNLAARQIGGTTDISAGQLIDRAGVMLGLQFPAGAALDTLACGAQDAPKPFAVKLDGFSFSLSGMENQMRRLSDGGAAAQSVAAFVIETVCSVVLRVTELALAQYGGMPVLFSGGVSSNSSLRRQGEERGYLFPTPRYAADNAAGVAILAHRAQTAG